MPEISPASARQFVEHIELPPRPRAGLLGAEDAPRIDFDALKDQATVIGSEVVSFVKGVTVERRQDIVNCATLAQLAANHRVADRTKIFDWYDAYFDVLANLGWVLQDKSFSAYEEKAQGLEAHEAILKVAQVLLAGSPGALAVVASTLDAMKSMDADNPWITIFDRESRSAETAKFQIALAEQEPDGRFMISMMAFGLKADSTLTQVLFFKIHSDKVSLRHCSGKVTINDDVLAGVRDKVRQKLVGHTGGYIDSLDLD